jgi:hypothetical protein
VVLGFNCADDPALAKDLLRENRVTFPTILDPSDTAERVASQGYHLTGVPLNYILDREGKVAAVWEGFEERDRQGLDLKE